MAGRVAEAAAVSALAALLAVVIAAPVLQAPTQRLFGMEIVGRHHDPFTVMEQFTRPVAFGVYLQPLTDVPGAMLAKISGPVAAYNLIVLLTFPLAAGSAYLLARHVALSRVSAAIAGFAFAFAPFHLAHAAYHPHIAQTQWIPLYLLALWRCLDNPRAVRIGLLAVSVIGVTLSNFYGGFIAGVLTPVMIAPYWYFKVRTAPHALRYFFITIGSLFVLACAGGVYGWSAAHASFVPSQAFVVAREDLFRYSATWWSYVIPPVEHPVLGGFAEHVWTAAGAQTGMLEQQVSLGWGILSLSLIAVVAWIRQDRPALPVATVPVLLSIAVVAVWCSMSAAISVGSFTFASPPAVLYRVLPMFRSYARFGVVVQLMAALLAGVGVECLWNGCKRSSRIVCVALLALAAFDYTVWPGSLWRDVLPTQAHRWVMQQPQRIRALDCAPMAPDSDSIPWLTGFRVSQNPSIEDCIEPDLVGKLSAAGYTHLLVRGDPADARRLHGYRLPNGLHSAAKFVDGEVFAVAISAPRIYTARTTGLYPREFDDSWTWRWMREQTSWTIVNTTNHVVVGAADIELTAFGHARDLMLAVDGWQTQTVKVEPDRRVLRAGPFVLSPGEHELVFHAIERPTVADRVMKNGDSRALSIAFGTWEWTVTEERP
jgi:hypothetical protein